MCRPPCTRRGAADEARQVEQAVGRGDPETVRAFSYTYLACLVHDVNLVHGALDALGLDAPAEAVASSAWAGGDAAAGTLHAGRRGVADLVGAAARG